jgi:hypothetical protein
VEGRGAACNGVPGTGMDAGSEHVAAANSNLKVEEHTRSQAYQAPLDGHQEYCSDGLPQQHS